MSTLIIIRINDTNQLHSLAITPRLALMLLMLTACQTWLSYSQLTMVLLPQRSYLAQLPNEDIFTYSYMFTEHIKAKTAAMHTYAYTFVYTSIQKPFYLHAMLRIMNPNIPQRSETILNDQSWLMTLLSDPR